MKAQVEIDCIKSELEYRSWKESSLWYCTKTLLKLDGNMECDFARDENTGLPITIQSADKPLDGVFESRAGTLYYTYHRGYAAAASHIAAVRGEANTARYLKHCHYLS